MRMSTMTGGRHVRMNIAINGKRPIRMRRTMKCKTHSQRRTLKKKKLSLKSRISKIARNLMRMTKTITADMREALRKWMHTYPKCRS